MCPSAQLFSSADYILYNKVDKTNFLAMNSAQTKVVPIRQVDDQASRNAMSIDKRRVINSAAGLLKNYLQKALASHFENIEQQMFEAADNKQIDDVKSDIKVLQSASQYISSLYIDSVIKNLSSFSGVASANTGHAFASSEETEDWSSLELVATDEIENQLLIDSYVSNCENRFKDVLYALRRRVEFISKKEDLKPSKNPFGPSILLNTYVELIKGESFSKNAQIILFNSFGQEVLENLGEVLVEVNELFIQADILPTLPKPKINNKQVEKKKQVDSFVNEKVDHVTSEQPRTVQESGEKGSPITSSVAGQPTQSSTMSMGDIDQAVYKGLLDMAKVYRSQGGDKVSTEGLVVAGEQLPTIELINTLTDLQKVGAAEGVDIKESVRLQIGSKVQIDGQRQPYSEQDDTLIDVVAMFFDVILQDRHLPDVVRAMIAQLQIPILKVAMLDKEFFARKSHPARKFLNALSQAGLGVSEKNHQIKSAVFDKMEELVARVLMDFDNDIELFAELLEEFNLFMEQQQHQINVIEERSRKVTKSTEQLELTKRQAAYEIALRLNGKAIPEFVQLFLDDAWKDVLVLALLRREKEPEETQVCIGVMERLITSVVTPVDETARLKTIETLSRLLKDIKVGLENISYDFHQSAPFFKELEAWHRRILAMGTDENEELPVAEEVVLVEFDKELSASLEEDLLNELENEVAQMPKDKFSKRANNMGVGDWVEYKNEEGGLLRAKLSWKSSVTMRCLFVNNIGSKALDISLVDLAEELRQKRMSVIGQEKAPLVERVLEGMKKMMAPANAETSLA